MITLSTKDRFKYVKQLKIDQEDAVWDALMDALSKNRSPIDLELFKDIENGMCSRVVDLEGTIEILYL